jgi:hypothetical protein
VGMMTEPNYYQVLKQYIGCEINMVKLPDGSKAIELERKRCGGSETTLSYTYIKEDGDKLAHDLFDRDYWGKVIDAKVV